MYFASGVKYNYKILTFKAAPMKSKKKQRRIMQVNVNKRGYLLET